MKFSNYLNRRVFVMIYVRTITIAVGKVLCSVSLLSRYPSFTEQWAARLSSDVGFLLFWRSSLTTGLQYKFLASFCTKLDSDTQRWPPIGKDRSLVYATLINGILPSSIKIRTRRIRLKTIYEPQRQETYLWTCAQRRLRSDYAFAQSDQNLHWAHFG